MFIFGGKYQYKLSNFFALKLIPTRIFMQNDEISINNINEICKL